MQFIKTYITYNQIFPNEKDYTSKLKDYINVFNKDELFYYIIQVNNLITHNQSNIYNIQISLIKKIFPKEQLNSLFTTFPNKKDFIFIFRGQLIEAINQLLTCSTIKNQEKGILKEKNKIYLLKYLLISSELWSNKTYGLPIDWSNNIIDYASSIRIGLKYSNRANQFEFYLGRGYYLYKNVFPRIYTEFEKVFKDTVKLSIDDYFQCFCYYIIFINIDNRNHYGFFSKEQIPSKNHIIKKFNNMFSIDKNRLYQKALSKDYISIIRNHPIIESQTNIIISDYICFLETLIDGPLFIIKNGNIKEDWFSLFGKAIELYIIDLFKRIFPESSFLTNRSHYNKKYIIKKNEFEIDWYLENIDSLMIAEIKTSFLPETMVCSEDHNDYINIINERYGISKHKDKPKIKGIGQLSKHILNYINKKITFIEDYTKIFPILITYDSYIGIPVTNNYLCSKFEELIEPESKYDNGFMKKSNYFIAPLIIISLEELEILEKSLSNFTLNKLFYDFVQYNKTNNETIYNFIVDSDYSKKLLGNTFLSKIGLRLLTKMKNTLFPNIESNS